MHSFLKARNSAEVELFNHKINYLDKQLNKVILSKGQRFIQEKVMANILATKYECKQYNGFITLIKQARHDLYMATFQNTQNFFWRNFSKYVVLDNARQRNPGPTDLELVSLF